MAESSKSVRKQKMRANEFLFEARRNPELSLASRLPIELQAAEFIRQIPASERSSWGARVSDHPQLTVNPYYQDSSPAGMYFFPADYFLKEIVKKPTKREAGFYLGNDIFYVIHVFKYDPTNVLVLNQVTDDDLNRTLTRIKETYPTYQKRFEERYTSLSDDLKKHNRHHPGQYLFWAFKILAVILKTILVPSRRGNDAMTCNKLLRTYGYTGLLDQGQGLIHGSEPTQGIILDPTIIKETKLFERETLRQHDGRINESK